MRIGFVGTTAGLTPEQAITVAATLEKIRNKYDHVELHHGDNKGADEQVHELLVTMDKPIDKIIIHPTSNSGHRAFCAERFRFGVPSEVLREEDFLTRNKNIIDFSDLMVICVKEDEEVEHSNSWITYRSATKINKKVILVFNNGNIKVWPDKKLIDKVKRKLHNGSKQGNTEENLS